MKIVELLSYDTTLTTPAGAFVRYSHELPSIGLAITKSKNPILFIVTDHEPIGETEKSITFYREDDGACGITIHDKNLNLKKFYGNYFAQGLESVLDEKPVISEILDYPIVPAKFDFIKSTIEGAERIDLVRLVVTDVSDFNEQLSNHLINLLANEGDVSNLSDVELKILLGSNQLTFFDICGVYEWIEENEALSDFTGFPLTVESILHQKISV